MKTPLIAALTLGLVACGGSSPPPKDTTPPPDPDVSEASDTDTPPPADEAAPTGKSHREANDAGEFAINDTDASSRPTQGKLQATDTEAAVRFFVVDKDNGPIEGIVIALTSPTGKKYYTQETDADGFAEVLLPVGKTYDLVYLSLGRRNVAAKVKVADKKRLNLKLTMRYKREEYPKGEPFILGDVQFETAKATLTTASYVHLDELAEYLTHKKSLRIEISGHTDNVGKKAANKKLSKQRADAVRDYLVNKKGIDASRLETVGYGDSKPIAPNNTPEGRQKNRRIEATEL